jgi:pantothenate synthetase
MPSTDKHALSERCPAGSGLSRMVKDLNYNLRWWLSDCPGTRWTGSFEPNTYLDTAQRKAAVVLSRSLRKARAVFASGELPAG